MDKETLYLMKTPFYNDRGGPFYCPDCIGIEGMLNMFPVLKEKLNIEHVQYQRPRPVIIDILGVANQSIPVLVLDPDAVMSIKMFNVMRANIQEYQGRYFINDEATIRWYLSTKFGLPKDSRGPL